MMRQERRTTFEHLHNFSFWFICGYKFFKIDAHWDVTGFYRILTEFLTRITDFDCFLSVLECLVLTGLDRLMTD